MQSAVVKYICDGSNDWTNHIEKQYSLINKSVTSDDKLNNIDHICDNLFILLSKIEVLNIITKSRESVEYKKKIKLLKNMVFKKYGLKNTMKTLQHKNNLCTSLSYSNENNTSAKNRCESPNQNFDDQKIKQLENKFSFVYKLHKNSINKIVIPESYSLADNNDVVNMNVSIDNYNYINSMIYKQTYRKELQNKFYRINKGITRSKLRSI